MRLTKEQRLGTIPMWQKIKVYLIDAIPELFNPVDNANAVVFDNSGAFYSKHCIWDIPRYIIPIQNKMAMMSYLNDEVAMEMEGDLTKKKCRIKNTYRLIEMHIHSLKGTIDYNLKKDAVLTYNSIGDFCGIFPNTEDKYLFFAIPISTKEEMIKYCELKIEQIEQLKATT